MSFLYANPGWYNMFDIVQVTTPTQVDNDNRMGGPSFYVSAPNILYLPDLTDVYVKFDIKPLATDDGTITMVRFETEDNQTITLCSGGRPHYVYIKASSGTIGTVTAPYSSILANNIYTLMMHLTSHETAGTVDVWYNGIRIIHLTDVPVVGGKPFKRFVICIGDRAYNLGYRSRYSNIILRDQPIGLTETVVSVPFTNDVDTDMDVGDGVYVSTAAGQRLFNSVDAAAMKTKYGEMATIHGISFGGGKLYRDTEDVTSVEFMRGSTSMGTVPLSANAYQATMLHVSTPSMSIDEFAAERYGLVTRA